VTNLAIPDSEVFQRFLAAADAPGFETDPDQVSLDIIARILNASSVDDVLGGAGAVHARDYLDTPFVLTGVRFNRSAFDGAGPQFYAVLEGADADGVPVAITCGAKNVIAQAWKLADMEALPIDLVIKQSSKATASGFHVMWLERAGASF
jgi:hypothetical protein